MNTRHKYQYGSLTRRQRIWTEDVWEYRYYETTPEGQRCRRSKVIGTLGQYPTRGDALRRLDRFRQRLNLQHRFGRPVTLDALVDHFVEKELPRLRYGTQQAHLSSLRRWIRPRWGRCLLDQVKGFRNYQPDRLCLRFWRCAVWLFSSARSAGEVSHC